MEGESMAFKMTGKRFSGPRPVYEMEWAKRPGPCPGCGQAGELYSRHDCLRCYACGWHDEPHRIPHPILDDRKLWPNGQQAR